ncbi:UbiX family flavin prenyltransferase [Geomonas sp. Red69]|uniref:Flavin prenyltransferase UbiX n=1 Tax=Geomonas diazotrophica TaxID=2843197 RepID=A0ABX8JGZ0_9BACT|nr:MULTISPECIES: flavin prenyltransferase UbiX [Geomonas]MBU5635288.1 UbiX family flavin prenyltransferase [Geomonas diazotrophica]QWV97658.1 UbiX family flavin prenyltransferase [Geomonas nitrogeniifigens]QXE86795.1 UbiX family flavin prenyltransferase [Geomonas nitrogeniifigens]
MKQRHFVVAITGASGSIYALRTIEELLRSGARVSVLISDAGFAVLREECGLEWGGAAQVVQEQLRQRVGGADGSLRYFACDDLFAPIASGSSAPDAMLVVPCSMGTLSRISCGNAGNLLERAADVMLKEARPLVLVPRETPLNAIHLEHMLKLSRLGVRIVPAMPGFYHQPQSMEDLVDFVVGKVLDSVQVEHTLFRRWGGE